MSRIPAIHVKWPISGNIVALKKKAQVAAMQGMIAAARMRQMRKKLAQTQNGRYRSTRGLIHPLRMRQMAPAASFPCHAADK